MKIFRKHHYTYTCIICTPEEHHTYISTNMHKLYTYPHTHTVYLLGLWEVREGTRAPVVHVVT